MKKNMSNDNRVLRLVLAVFFIVLYLQGIANSVWGIVFLVVAGILAITAITGFCPLYSLFRINRFGKK